ncbi:hypothetical protein Clacol_008498 [Clathrus columnatus]|uniref:TPR-like protein n=1 Tax=Clathrus columnatus TaxID=1419009 RepID=A0AAV5AIQ8_9AGAM|nr:hypothetical protein Clacol_008498 [Clathrus columnatus]
MNNPKAQFYTNQLYSALTAGEWSSDFPSKGLRKGNLSWSELLRKFRKHRPDALEVAEIASHTQSLCLLLSRSNPPTLESLDDDRTIPHEPLSLGDECLLQEDQKEGCLLGYQSLKNITPSDSSCLTMAFYAFASGSFMDALQHLALVNFDNLPSFVNASNTGTGSTMMSFPISYDSSGTVSSFLSSLPSLEADMKAGRLWRIVELIRGRCLQGMAYESLKSYQKGLQSYEDSLPLLDRIVIPKSLSSASLDASHLESFIHFREVWRWVERLLRRAAVLSAKLHSPFYDNTHRIFRLYQTHSVHWPPTFRPNCRSVVATLHLHLLLRIYNHPTSLCPSKSVWLNEFRSIVTDYRVVLTTTTKFPRAGERNVKVEDFVDICMAAWEVCGASGDQTGWIIDILWWATRFTFNSHRIFRHLTRTLYASGDPELARRTLKLYVQIINKERETKAGDEPDRVWTETLVQGARMLCRIPNGGMPEVREAGELIKLVEIRLNEPGHESGNEDLKADVLRAKGVWHSCMAIRERDPVTRPNHLSSAITAFESSLTLDPSSPSTHFHLALALTRPGPAKDLTAAISHARSAVVADPKEIRYWHLLGLLLTGTEEWKKAREVLLEGMRIAEEEEEIIEQSLAFSGSSTAKTNGSRASVAETYKPNSGKEVPASPSPNSNDNIEDEVNFLPLDAISLPPASTFLRSAPDYPPPTRHERFEYALQIRLTLLALIEHVDGAENAGDGWLDVFIWVAGRKGLGEERRPPSVEPPPSDPSVLDVSHGHLKGAVPLSLNLSTIRSRRTSHHEKSHVAIEEPIAGYLNPPSIYVEKVDDHRQESPNQSPIENGETSKGRSSGDDPKRKNKNVQQMLKAQVHKSQAHIHTISRKIGRGHLTAAGAKAGARLKRASSAPDFHIPIGHHTKQVQYQASSIHSRPRLSSTYVRSTTPTEPGASRAQATTPERTGTGATDQVTSNIFVNRSCRERRLMSNLWLTSAATFRRMGKIEQALTAIQEAEMADENNENVWVQLGLYYTALGEQDKAIASFYKALFINPDCVAAFAFLTREYLTTSLPSSASLSSMLVEEDEQTLTSTRFSPGVPISSSVRDNIDLAAGLLNKTTRGLGWDVPEVWYFLAKALGMQGKKDRERECLVYASSLMEGRGVRDTTSAIGWWL